MEKHRTFTIGFTRHGAEKFFSLLAESGAQRIIDVRLNNVSQLAGFAKRDDLKFFAQQICGMDYVHLPELAPTKEILDAYKKRGGEWRVYEDQFLALMDQRSIEKSIDPELLNGGCLLCSEHKPHFCHRRLVAEYLCEKWGGNLSVEHLV